MDSLRNNLEKQLKLFLLLKLFYDGVVIKKDESFYKNVLPFSGYKCKKSFDTNFDRLLQLDWIVYKSHLNQFSLRSFDRINIQSDETANWYCTIKLSDLNRFKGFLGGAVFAFCHAKFWRKFIFDESNKKLVPEIKLIKLGKRKRRVVKNNETTLKSHPLPSVFNFSAPIALNGVKSFLNLSKSKINRLKEAANQEKYLIVQSGYSSLGVNAKLKSKYLKFSENGSYCLEYRRQLYIRDIDRIKPLLKVFKRKKRNYISTSIKI